MAMTEAEWLACTDPTPMLEFLRGKVSDRKLRLFAFAACLPVAYREDGLRTMMYAVERYADGEAGWNDLSGVRKAARQMMNEAMQGLLNVGPGAVAFIEATANPSALRAVEAVVALYRAADTFRDIVSNPFRSPVLLPAVLAWSDSTVRRIAQGIYDDRIMPHGTFDTARLAVLADALLDAGCDDAELIAHCRSAEPHVRGCWAIDLILGKQ
jgi:hypothetical protein